MYSVTTIIINTLYITVFSPLFMPSFHKNIVCKSYYSCNYSTLLYYYKNYQCFFIIALKIIKFLFIQSVIFV